MPRETGPAPPGSRWPLLTWPPPVGELHSPPEATVPAAGQRAWPGAHLSVRLHVLILSYESYINIPPLGQSGKDPLTLPGWDPERNRTADPNATSTFGLYTLTISADTPCSGVHLTHTHTFRIARYHSTPPHTLKSPPRLLSLVSCLSTFPGAVDTAPDGAE